MAVCAHLGLLEDSLTCHQQASGWVVGGGWKERRQTGGQSPLRPGALQGGSGVPGADGCSCLL